VRWWSGADAKEADAARVRVECARYVSHPNIAAVSACEPSGDTALWIVSEYVPGPTLEAWAAAGKTLPLPAAIDLVRNLSQGLYAAAAEGLTHHAIQPRNIIVSPKARSHGPWLDAKLVDLSLAAWMRPAWPNLYNSHFIAPETLSLTLRGIDASDSIDARANVYACGALLYLLVTGSLPFRSSSRHDLSIAQLNGKLVAPQAHNPEISPALQTVILSALAVQREARYAHTSELASVLAAAAWRDGYTDSYEPSLVQPLPFHGRRSAEVTESARRVRGEITTRPTRIVPRAPRSQAARSSAPR
jgi:serine/threonine-protein kinase